MGLSFCRHPLSIPIETLLNGEGGAAEWQSHRRLGEAKQKELVGMTAAAESGIVHLSSYNYVTDQSFEFVQGPTAVEGDGETEG